MARVTSPQRSGKPTARRVRRQPDDARRNIIESTQALIDAGRAVKEINVATLMDHAGMSRSSFYHYFSSIDAVVVAILHELAGEVERAGSPWLHLDIRSSPRRALEESLRNLGHLFVNHGAQLHAIDEASHTSRAVRDGWRHESVDSMVAAVSSQLAIQRDAGLIGDQIDPRSTAHALVLMNNAVMLDRLTGRAPDSVEAVVDVLLAVWTRTLYPTP